MKIGYIRVSTKEQNESRQLIKMKKLGIEERFIFIDKVTGKNFNREQYKAMKQVIRTGDLIYIDSLDRLGRNYDEIIREWKYITRELKADIIILENQSLFDSRKFKSMGDMGKLMEDQFLSLLSYVAEQELKKIKKRQREGIESARLAGKQLGRPKINLNTLSLSQERNLKNNYDKWKKGNIKSIDFMELLQLKKTTFYKIIKQYEKSNIKK